MKFNYLVGLASLLAQSVHAIKEEGKYVKLSFDKSIGTQFNESSSLPLHKRHENGYSIVDIRNQQSFFSVQLSIGSPAQDVTVLIDTGSSDLWVMGSEACSSSSSLFSSLSNNYRKLYERDSNEVEASDSLASASDDDLHNDLNPWQWITSVLGDPMTGDATNTVEIETRTATATATSTRTGSSSSNSNSNSQTNSGCRQYGTFNSGDSSTFNSNDTSFEITYGDSSYASGTWGMDLLTMDGVNVTGVSFAVANFTNSSIGVLGIGLAGLETTTHEYNNLPLVMRNSGIIEHTAYSLYLNDGESQTGNVLFGAVDHAQYSGTLNTIPLVNIYANQGLTQPVAFHVTLQGIGLSTSSENTTIATTKLPALLDSGTTIAYFPQSLLELTASSLGATYDSNLGYYTMSCPTSSDDTSLVFDFGGFHITAPLSDFVSQYTYQNCMLLISTVGDQVILGDVFLQNAYVVYDLENHEISMAQANYNGESNEDSIELIQSSVPNAVRAASYSNTWSTGMPVTSGGNIFTVAASNVTSTGRTTQTTRSTTGSARVTSTLTGNTESGSATTLGSSVRRENVGDHMALVPSFTSSVGLLLMALLL